MGGAEEKDWKLRGVRVIRSTELDPNTAQTPGMKRAAAITHARTGAGGLSITAAAHHAGWNCAGHDSADWRLGERQLDDSLGGRGR